MDHVLRFYANPLKQGVYLLFSLLFVAAGLALIHSSRPTPVGLYVLVLGYLDIMFFGLGSCVLLVSIVRGFLRPRLALQVDTHGWTYTPAGLDWTQHAAWQEVSRIAIQRQRISRSKRRFLLVLEEERRGDAAQSDASTSATSPSPPSSAVVMFVELDSIFPYATPGRRMRVLEGIRTEFAAELDRYSITVATTIVDI